MLFGFEQKRFWRDALDHFQALTSLDAAIVLLAGRGRQFKVLERRGPWPDRQPEPLALAPHLEGPCALVDAERVLLMVPLRLEGVTQAVLCGLRPQAALPFTPHDIGLLEQMAARMLEALTHLEPEPAVAPKNRPGPVAGRYVRGLKILSGRFSSLYGAFDEETRQHVLLRRLEADQQGRQARQHLLAEGRFLARLEHENLPRFLATVDDESGLYLVLEAFSGSTLEQKIQSCPEPFSAERLADYLRQFLDVLQFLHGLNPPLIQRDLRPGNVMSTNQERLKLLDFGLARLKDSPCDPRQTTFRGLGDPVYAAPEQLLGQPSEPGHDLYAVGSILYYLATRTTPPRAGDRRDGSALEVPLSELRPDLPADWVATVERLRHPDPARRPGSAAQVLREVAENAG